MASATATLPQYVVFKGDNGNYLGSIWAEGHPYQQMFASDIASERVRFQVVPVNNEEGHGEGVVRIKSLYQNNLWRHSPNWIWADTPAEGFDTSKKDLLFLPVQVDLKTVGLRCLGNDAFCKRLTTDYKNDCLNTGTWLLEKSEMLGVEKPVLQCSVRSVVYDVDSAEIHQRHRVRSWNNSVSFTTGISATITAGVPEVSSTSVTVFEDVTTITEWGATEETEKSVGANYHVTVDPGKTVKVDLQATLAKCDVKFSYEQVDLLTTGDTVVTYKNDGLYKGMNYINITYVANYI
ncbi:hypothetical protein KI387_021123 [Taxus chinensis]|uniref:Agglutinin domain-containing protein n=1 Tax=Taxus chinensis TaxID=29808 RepID=A0AA38LC34_TAXCH|nr:hypothetical protein KI387_021123 [Taxus chinensis]